MANYENLGDAKLEEMTEGMTETVAAKKQSKTIKTESDDIKELKAQNEQLQAQINALMKMFATMGNGSDVNERKNSLLDEVTIVHLVERAPGLTTTVRLSNLEISMSKFGEERTIDRRQAEELVGNHRSLFEDGIIAFGRGNKELAEKLSVKSVDAYGYADTEFVHRLGMLDARQLEELYSKLCPGHQAFIIEYFKRKIMEKNPAFMDAAKIDVLNRLSGKAMFDVLLDKDRDEKNAERKNK